MNIFIEFEVTEKIEFMLKTKILCNVSKTFLNYSRMYI